MAEDMGDKTEAPTPRRRQEAREQGNIARSPDIVAAALLLGVMYTLSVTGPNLVKALRSLMAFVMSPSGLSSTSSTEFWQMCATAVRAIGAAMAPLLLAAMG